MKKPLIIFLLLLISSFLFAQEKDSLTQAEKERREQNIQAGNPFKKYGYTPKIATLSKGKYLEWHDLDSIVIIGSVYYNTKSKKIIDFVERDMTYPNAQPLSDIRGRWISPDPLSEEFPDWSPYNYALNNPINLMDPTGMAPEDWVGKNNANGTTSWSWDDNITSLEQAKAAGYDDYRAPGSIIDNGKINGQSGTDGQTSVYLGQSANDVSFTYPNSTVTPFQVGTEWLSGTGPRHRDFTNGDYFTELLRQHEHIGNARSTIMDNVANGGALTGNSPYELGGVQGVGLYIKDYSTLLTGGATGNLAVTYLGSYNLKWSATPNAENGTISVNFSVGNTSTMQSASRPPVIGYLPGWQNTVGRRINEAFQTGWGSKTSQSFNWTETLQMRK